MWALIIGVAVIFGPPLLIGWPLWNRKFLHSWCKGFGFYNYGYTKGEDGFLSAGHKFAGIFMLVLLTSCILATVGMVLWGCYEVGNAILEAA